MSSDKQRAIDIFTRLYNDNDKIHDLLDDPGPKFYIKIKRVLDSDSLNEEDTEFIKEMSVPERRGGFSDDVWKEILTRVTNPNTSTTTVFADPGPVGEDGGYEETKTAKGRSETLPRGSTTAWQKQPARTASTASQGSTWARGKTVPMPKGKMGKTSGTHLTTKTNYTSVELATAFCPGIKVDDNEARLLFGEDFLQILKQYNDLKDEIFRKGDLFTEMLNCGSDNTEKLMNKLNRQSDERRIFYLLNYLEFLLNCLRQLIIKFKAGGEFNERVKMIQDEFDVVLKSLQEIKLKSGSGTDKAGKETFEFYLKQNNNYAKLIERLTSNFGKLINSIQTREERGESGVGGSGGWVTVSDKKEEENENPLGHDYSKISNSRDLAKEVRKGSELKKQNNPSGHPKYRLEWLLKSFMNNTIKLWCEENHSKIIEYIRKLKRKNNTDSNAANKAALEFLTKLMILLLQDINRVSSERLVNNKFLLSLFARSSLCSLLVNPEVFTKRATTSKFAQDVFTSEKLQTSQIKKMTTKKLTEGIAMFGTQPISKHLQEGLIFSPLDYYIAIIESQQGDPGLGDKSAEPTFSAHLDEFKGFIKERKSFCYGSSYTKMFSLKLDEDMDGVRGEFVFKPLWDIGEEEGLTGGMDWLSGAATVGLSRDGNLSIIKPGDQTKTAGKRMKFIANILTESLGYTSALLCLGLSDIGSIAYKAGTESWGNNESTARLQAQVDSIDVWREIVGTECKLIYLLLPPVPWQDPREVFNGLWANQLSEALGRGAVADFLNKSGQIIDVCNKIANRTYYEEYLGMWQKKQQKGQFDLWCLKESGISELQTCRVYTLQNIHYDYNLLRNLYFTEGELRIEKGKVEGIKNIENALERQYLHITPQQIDDIRQLSLHKFSTSTQKKYWLLDAQAQLFKENFAKKRQGDSMESFVENYHEYKVAMIKNILDVDSNLIKKEEDSGIQRLVGDKLTAVFQGFKPLTAKNEKAKGPFAVRLREIWAKVSKEGETRDNTFKFLEHVMINITRAVENLPQQVDKAHKRLLNYERTAVVLLLDNLVGLSFFRMDSSIEQGTQTFLQEYFYASGSKEEGGFALPWTSPRITAAAGFYIGSRRFNEQFIFDYCIGEFLGRKTRDNDKLIACCRYKDGEFVRRYVALLPTQETGLRLGSTATSASTSSQIQIPVQLQRQGSQDTDVEDSERRRTLKEIKELLRIKKMSEQQKERLIYLQENVKRRDAFVSQHYKVTSPRSQDESDKSKKPGGRGGKRTRKRRKSKKPRKTKSKRFHKKKHKTRKKKHSKRKRKHKTKRR